MISKDEEEWIGQCITSVKPIISEIILVDTGSTDKTIEIAQSLGAKVLHRPWDDDFSAPRNLSLKEANSNWILVLDADEAIAPRDLEPLQKLTLNPSLCYEFNQRHYTNDVRMSAFRPATGEYPEFERDFGGFFESGLCRLFPNRLGIEYIGRVHELVEHSIKTIKKLKIVQSKIPIHHYGHTEAVRAKKSKGKLYTPLGAAKLGEDPSDWKAWFELAVEHNNNGRQKESAVAFRKSLSLNPTYIHSWVNLGYVLCELTEHEEAIKALKSAIELDKGCFEAYCNLGVVYLRTSQFPLAERCFRIAVKLSPTYVNAICNLGKSIAFQGRHSEAVNIYLHALELLPRCTTAKVDLALIYLASKLYVEAKKYAESALEDEPQNQLAREALNRINSTGM